MHCTDSTDVDGIDMRWTDFDFADVILMKEDHEVVIVKDEVVIKLIKNSLPRPCYPPPLCGDPHPWPWPCAPCHRPWPVSLPLNSMPLLPPGWELELSATLPLFCAELPQPMVLLDLLFLFCLLFIYLYS